MKLELDNKDLISLIKGQKISNKFAKKLEKKGLGFGFDGWNWDNKKLKQLIDTELLELFNECKKENSHLDRFIIKDNYNVKLPSEKEVESIKNKTWKKFLNNNFSYFSQNKVGAIRGVGIGENADNGFMDISLFCDKSNQTMMDITPEMFDEIKKINE